MRWCPSCETERGLGEVLCQGCIEKGFEPWPISEEPIRPTGWRPEPPVSAPAVDSTRPILACPNGHPITAGDFICPVCHTDVPTPAGLNESQSPYETDIEIGPDSDGAITAPVTIDGWHLERRLETTGQIVERFIVTKADRNKSAVLTLYATGFEPDPSVYALLQRLPRDHIPELITTGRWSDRAYDVCENMETGSLAERPPSGCQIEAVRTLALEIGTALRDFAEAGLRHRNLRPPNILIRTEDPLDLVITGFGSARLSEFDLDIVAPLELTPYSAPEAVIGAVAPASDWWSLGMILLEQITEGRCFEGINPRVFLMHALATGVPVSEDLPSELRTLLRGLLVRDQSQRWGWKQLKAWLDGEPVEVPPEVNVGQSESDELPTIVLGGKTHTSPIRFALEAAGSEYWDEARDLLMRGEVASWSAEVGLPSGTTSALRQVARRDGLHDDFRLSVALKLLNENMPLTFRGDIINPPWLRTNSELGYELIDGPAPDILEVLGSEVWLTRLRVRATAVREKARLLEIQLEEAALRAYILSTSRSQLASEWDAKRRLFPDTEHAGIASLMERRQSSEEDLIILLAADPGFFRSRDEVIEEAAQLAQRAGILGFDPMIAEQSLELSRSDLIAEVRKRTGDLARCNISRADEWVEQLRLERRLPIARALALLAIPAEHWLEPPKHEYYQRILEYFEKKVTVSLARGPLVRMTIGKTTPRIDVSELGTQRRSPDDIVSHVLRRSDQKLSVDPAIFAVSEGLPESRLRHLVQSAAIYKRDTGIDGLYLGFPFLVARDGRSTTKPRIAPVLLWPVRVDVATGVRGDVTIAFDREREDVRINPALEGIVGIEEMARWRELIDELLGRSTLNPPDIMDAFATLATSTGRQISKLPARDVQLPPSARRITASAVLFHLSYIGQAIVDDLRRLKSRAPDSTSLAALLRISDPVQQEITHAAPREVDRFFSAASDPSQEDAVFKARHSPGLLLEGPPGTGKSQTIVNVIGDAIGRKKSVLVVCQKFAAIDVVRKRLEKEGLQDRCVMITDINKDRQPLLQMIRDQVFNLRRDPPSGISSVNNRRKQLASLIEELEGQLDRRHDAVHRVDEQTGSSYRSLLSELVDLEAAGVPPIDVPKLRRLLQSLPPAQRTAIEEACASLARYWLPSKFERSPLRVLKIFQADPATVGAFSEDFERFASVEAMRVHIIAERSAVFEVENPGDTLTWLSDSTDVVAAQSGEQRENLARWISLFHPAPAVLTDEENGRSLILELDELVTVLNIEASSAPPVELQRVLLPLDETVFSKLERASGRVLASTSLISRLSPFRYAALRQLRRFLRDHKRGEVHDVALLHEAIRFERELRTVKQRLQRVLDGLGIDTPTVGDLSFSGIRRLTASLRVSLGNVAAVAEMLAQGPQPNMALEATKTHALPIFFEEVAQAIKRCKARADSAAALEGLGSWFEDKWLSSCQSAIAMGKSNTARVESIAGALPTVEAFQEFRRRAAGLDKMVLAVFEFLREVEGPLEALPTSDLAAMVRRIIAREPRLAQKAALEEREISLLMDQGEIETKIQSLADADQKIRVLNSRLLADGIDNNQVQGSQQTWTSITRLRAANGVLRSSIRDLIENGRDLGLFELRPVWLVNPDVASRILPLTPGLFDVVVYDEASQMPIEYALPTLFRAGIAVVSGDEKQMPPTSFFAGRMDGDEEDLDVDVDDTALSESAREALEETWNRREIKDCPDLLNLARVSLPTTMLEVHYRSAYRELIAFSNAAFYGNRLNVPIQHPDSIVLQERPIEIIQVNGTYSKQTNSVEADRIVDLLAGYWSEPQHRRPSIGVVTFNRKQADLIEDRLEERAEEDEAFRAAYIEEQQRTQDHEDIGFFVKNVENVQGDERDVIIFSTTFGRNEHGSFRRNFGVLGQHGGRRRLNVAITRAKRKVIVATSIPIGDVSDMMSTHRPPMTERDYLQGYLEFGRAITAQDLDTARSLCRRMVTEGKRTEERNHDLGDGFKCSVERFIREIGYDPVSGERGDAFNVDLAIVDPNTGLYGIGIECDAPRHQILARARARELWRPQILSGTVRSLHRISCAEWYERRTYEQERLRAAIASALSNPGGRAA